MGIFDYLGYLIKGIFDYGEYLIMRDISVWGIFDYLGYLIKGIFDYGGYDIGSPSKVSTPLDILTKKYCSQKNNLSKTIISLRFSSKYIIPVSCY